MEKIKLFIYKLLSTINHKDIGILYLFCGFIAGIIGTIFNIIIRVELAYPGIQILEGNWQFYNLVVTKHAFIMIFFMVMPSMIMALPRLNALSFWLLLLSIFIGLYLENIKNIKINKCH